MEERVE